MFELENADRDTIKKCSSLSMAKSIAKEKFGDDVWFDGDPEFGATEIYIYDKDEEVVGYIIIND